MQAVVPVKTLEKNAVIPVSVISVLLLIVLLMVVPPVMLTVLSKAYDKKTDHADVCCSACYHQRDYVSYR